MVGRGDDIVQREAIANVGYPYRFNTERQVKLFGVREPQNGAFKQEQLPRRRRVNLHFFNLDVDL